MKETIWRKSSYSGQNGQCIELADLDRPADADHRVAGRPGEGSFDGQGFVGMRDSKLGDASPILTLTREQMADLVADIKAGDLDHLAQ